MKQEVGRSMVEMLGVLAIIGVLSIGGIAGYTIAMSRHRANEILDLAAKVAVMGKARDNGVANLTDIGIQNAAANPIHGVTGMASNAEGNVILEGNIADNISNAMSSIAADRWTPGTRNTSDDGYQGGTFTPVD